MLDLKKVPSAFYVDWYKSITSRSVGGSRGPRGIAGADEIQQRRPECGLLLAKRTPETPHECLNLLVLAIQRKARQVD
jgi:hypothetical protein